MVEANNQEPALLTSLKQGGLHSVRYNSLCRLNENTALLAHGASIRAFKIEENEIVEIEELYTQLGHEAISVLKDF